ncbi:MAG: UDP-3-O-(3-hydroxymyristoyl)glucosamine N-acyltransferase [Pseudomonadota bacterium]
MSATLSELAELTGAELQGDSNCIISGVNTLENATTGELAFLSNRHYAQFLEHTNAAAVVLAEQDIEKCNTNILISSNPYLSFAKIVNFLYPKFSPDPAIHETAIIGNQCQISPNSFIAPGVVIGDNVVVDDGVLIGAGVVIEDNVRIGKSSKLLSNNTICKGVVIGKEVTLHPGAIIGSAGFGMAEEDGKWLTIPQLGSVIIGNNVEIGANTTVDRGAIDNTIIEDGVRIDNQVQIAHNVIIGEDTAIAGCVAIAGSVKIGKRCKIGGLSAITGHIEICDDVMITGMSGVPNSIKTPGVYSSGLPVTDNRTWRKNMARFRKLDEIIKKIQRQLG